MQWQRARELIFEKFNSRLYWAPQVGPGHEARVQLELNSAPVLHIYDRWQPWLNPPSFFKTLLSTKFWTAETTARAALSPTASPCLARVSSFKWVWAIQQLSNQAINHPILVSSIASQVGDEFRVVLVRGCLGVDGGQYLSFLGHRLAPSLPWEGESLIETFLLGSSAI